MPTLRETLGETMLPAPSRASLAERPLTPPIAEASGEEAVYLDEDQVGVAKDKVGFPHLLLCQGVVCAMKSGEMIGAHFVGEKTQMRLLNQMNAEILKLGGPTEIDKVFVAYDSRKKPAGMLNAKEKAEVFGFSGDVAFFDTASMKNKPTDGTYVEIKNKGAAGFEMNYAKHENMIHGQGRQAGSRVWQTLQADAKPGKAIKPVGEKQTQVKAGPGL